MNMKFDLFHRCLQGVAVTKWDLCANKYKGDKRTKKNFKRCFKDYLEAIAKCTHLGDQVIRWLCLGGKPANMWFKEFLNRLVQILKHVKKEYLRRCMELPNDNKLCEQVFLAQPKAPRIKHAEKHRVVETNMLKHQEFFKGCHGADVHRGEYARLMDGKKKAKENTKAKNTSHSDWDRHTDRRDRQDRDRYGYQDRKDRDRHRDDKPRRTDDRGYAKAMEPAKDRKGGPHAHHVESNDNSPCHCSHSCSADSSIKEVKRVRVRSSMRERFRSSSPSDSEENYHLQSGDSPTKADEDSSE